MRIDIRTSVCVSVLLIWGAFAVVAGHARHDLWQRADLNASSTGRLIGQDLDRNLDVLDLTLDGLKNGLSFPGLAGLSLEARNQILYDRASSADFFANLFVLNENGDLAVDPAGLTPRRLNYADREYFRFLRDHPGRAMYLSRPALSKVGVGWTIPVAIRLTREDGSFAGAAVGGLRLEYILGLFQKSSLGPRDALVLVRGDGTVMAQWPPRPGTIGASIADAPVFQRLAQAGAASMTGPGAFDRTDRYWIPVPIGKYPLTLIVGLSTRDMFSLWYWRVTWIGSALLVLSGIVAALTFRLVRELHRRTRSEALLARRNAELELGRHQFDAALSNMSQGLTFFDRNQKLIVCNQRYAELYGLSPDQTRPGTSLADILRHRITRDSVANTMPADYPARLDALARAGEPFDLIDELRDGRIICMRSRPLPNGGWVTTHEDITEQRRAEANLVFMARHDALTRLPNRVLFHERLARAIDLAGRGNGCAVLYLDLDRFKPVNDTLGHPVGDILLQAVAERLRSCVRDGDTVARLGGDEFAIIQVGVEHAEDAELVASRVVKALRNDFEIEGHRISVGASVGIALAPADGSTPEILLKNADTALYNAKAERRGTVRFFQPEADARLRKHRTLETASSHG